MPPEPAELASLPPVAGRHNYGGDTIALDP
jgi:hypothetical protein